MDRSAYLTAVERSGRALSADALRVGLDAIVPTCPGWTVERLVVHQGNVHRWAAEIVGASRTAPPSEDENERLFARSDDVSVLKWYDEGLTRLLDVLTKAPADVQCWSFLPAPSPREFWTRRQAHETSIHSADAALAAGVDPMFDADLAADGLDELLVGFYGSSGSRLVGEPAFSVSMQASDVDRCWTLSRGTEGVSVSDAFDGDCRLTGCASDLYLFAWNRLLTLDRLDVAGDTAAIDVWRENLII